MDIELITAPTKTEILALISVAKIKAEQRFFDPSEDVLFEDFIEQAFNWFDGPHGWLRRAVLPQQWTLYLTDFPRRAVLPTFPYPFLADGSTPIEIPMPPLKSIQEIAYRDSDNAWNVVDSAVYEVITPENEFGRATLAIGQEWPLLVPRERAVRVKFTCGYDADKVPKAIQRGLRYLAGYFWMNRNASFEDTRVTAIDRKIVFGLEAIAGRYRFMNDLVGG